VVGKGVNKRRTSDGFSVFQWSSVLRMRANVYSMPRPGQERVRRFLEIVMAFQDHDMQPVLLRLS
jgi:hypothetical protein